MNAAAVSLRDVGKNFATPDGPGYRALKGVTFEVGQGEFLSIVGPSGCGKSTLLNLVAGLQAPTAGQILFGGVPQRGITRRASYLFQVDALLPWKTVRDNVALGLVFRGQPRAEAHATAQGWIRRVGLNGFEDRYPHQLSGGMRKRVALAQSLVVEPDLLLMDEPFTALDVQTRALMENELLSLWSEYRKTVLFVTHDLEEAIAMADRVVLLTAGPASGVKGDYPIDLPRPRNVAEVRFQPAFAKIYERVWNDLKDEVLTSYARSLEA
jgi:NitT/TauT family transport system ATP-binding protein